MWVSAVHTLGASGSLGKTRILRKCSSTCKSRNSFIAVALYELTLEGVPRGRLSVLEEWTSSQSMLSTTLRPGSSGQWLAGWTGAQWQWALYARHRNAYSEGKRKRWMVRGVSETSAAVKWRGCGWGGHPHGFYSHLHVWPALPHPTALPTMTMVSVTCHCDGYGRVHSHVSGLHRVTGLHLCLLLYLELLATAFPRETGFLFPD